MSDIHERASFHFPYSESCYFLLKRKYFLAWTTKLLQYIVRCWCNDICCVLHHDNLNAFYIFEAYEKPSLMLLLRSIACLSHPLDCDSYICYFSCTLHVIKENKNKYLYPYVVHKGAITSTIAWMKESTSR